MLIEHLLDGLADPPKRNCALKESSYCHLICRVKHGRSCSASSAGCHSGAQRPEDVRPDGLEGERAGRYRIESADARVGQPFRMRESVQDRKFHTGKSELGQDASVTELDKCVDHALGMDDDFESVIGYLEEVVRLDQLERLVSEGGAINRDLMTHLPGGVPQRFVHRGMPDSLGRPFAERAARCRQDQASETGLIPSGNALEHGTVLRI